MRDNSEFELSIEACERLINDDEKQNRHNKSNEDKLQSLCYLDNGSHAIPVQLCANATQVGGAGFPKPNFIQWAIIGATQGIFLVAHHLGTNRPTNESAVWHRCEVSEQKEEEEAEEEAEDVAE